MNSHRHGAAGHRTATSALALAIAALASGAAHAAPAAAVPAAAASVPLSDWVTHNGNARHTGYVPLYTGQAAIQALWTATIAGGLPLNAAATSDGRVFVTQNGWFADSQLTALDLHTGQVLWSKAFPDSIYGHVPILNAPGYKDGMALVTTGGQEEAALWGFDAATGQQVFRSQLGNQWERYLAPVPFGNSIYTEDGTYGGAGAFVGTTGAQRWAVGLPQYDTWTPAIDQDYVYAYTTELDVLNRADGTLAYSIPDNSFNWMGYTVACAPALGGASDAFVTQGGRVIAFNLAQHKVRWQRSGDLYSGTGYRGQVSVADGKVFVATSSTVEVRDELTGKLLGTYAPTGASSGAPVTSTIIVTKNLFFVSTDTQTDAVSLDTLKRVWHAPRGGQLALSKDGILVITSSDGTVTAVSTQPTPAR